MKIFTLLLIVVCLSSSSVVMAQQVSSVVVPPTTHCPIPCGNQSFPYLFCFVTGSKTALCSTNPNDPITGYVPAKSKMPGCVNIVPIDASLWWQPASAVPDFTETPPDKETMWEEYESAILACSSCWPPPYDLGSDEWEGDEKAYDYALEQWDLDSSSFFNQTGEAIVDTIGLDDDFAWDFIVDYRIQAHSVLWNNWDTTYGDYQRDSTRHFKGNDVSYAQVFSSGDANVDGQNDLNSWLGICSLTGDATCCIAVEGDTNVTHWPGNYEMSGNGIKLRYPVGLTYGTPGCPDGSSCPNPSSRYITYNATNNFFYENNSDIILISPEYILHPAVPLHGWYTGAGPNADAANQGYYDFSFKEVIEHEMGHWLGLLHPDSILRGDTCKNNYNYCKSSIPGYWMLMGAGQAQPNIPPRGLGTDDSCMFAKLYCPTLSDTTLAVSTPQVPDWFNPEVFPNPSNGEMTLTFTTLAQSLTQISIYDVLGNQVRLVSSGYEESGPQSISLGTETLPSGSYVCRVRVGDRVSYINLAITK